MLPAGRRVVAVGRLVAQKGFDLLLQAFARLQGRYPDWSLVIVGEGPLRAELEGLVERLGLSGRVFLPGLVQAVPALLKRCDLFVLASRYEGFPNALGEAMAAGLPVIAADCPTGPRELVRHGVDGLLVPPEDPATLAEAMDRLMGDGEERRRLAGRAVEVTARFSEEKVLALWDQVLAEAGVPAAIDGNRSGHHSFMR